MLREGQRVTEPAARKPTYEDLFSLPDSMTGEIIGGEIFATPRPSRHHAYAASALNARLGSPYQFGESGGPGGWVILMEPEIGLGEHILVPDLAGWKVGRFPFEEDRNWISTVPDWVCEILSPRTAGLDKSRKMPVYAQFGVAHAWLLDPIANKTLDVYRLEPGGWWRLLESYGEDNDRVRAEPFQEVEIRLADLWMESLKPPGSRAE
jgi:Uma2 family endonuclease